MLWRRVQDEKPSIGRRVIVAVKLSNGHVIRTFAEYVPKYSVLAEDYMGDLYDPDLMDIGDDGKEYAPEGWWEYTVESDESYLLTGEVLYWMYAPELPWVRG